jgi:poly-gamma-glutamate system protein
MKRIFRLAVLLLIASVLPAWAFDDPRQNDAVELMRRCEQKLWSVKQSIVPEFDQRLDPDHTGLIGLEISPLATTPGSWHDKRWSSQPEMAGAVAGYLIRAGVRENDWIGINATSSYPGFVLAAHCAAKALKLNTVFVLSYGSSMYGADIPKFTLPVMFDVLRDGGIMDVRIDGLTPGGIDDRIRRNVLGQNALPDVLILMAQRSETCLVPEDHYASMMFRRALFGSRPLKAFVNCGGSWLSLGVSIETGKLMPHGLIMPPPAVEAKGWNRGLIMDYLEKGVPCIHLLFTRGICEDWGLKYESGPEPNF